MRSGGARGALFCLLRAALLVAVLGSAAAAQTVCGLPAQSAGPRDDALRAFAQSHHVRYVEAFVAVVDAIERSGRLPDCYLTKRAAETRGWREGRDLWRVVPGAAIGGNRFSNRDGRLPAEYGGRYREADLDYDGGHRGDHRIIFVAGKTSSGLVWLTTDHYRHFDRVPAAE